MSRDQTKTVLEETLAALYKQQAQNDPPARSGSYLVASDGQFLGKITTNNYDSESMLNQYGSYGSPYSPTSIFNKYSQYGNAYGQYSPYNPYSTTPPKLFLNSKFFGNVAVNQYVRNRIPTNSFIYSLTHHVDQLLRGNIIASELEFRQKNGESFIVAADGVYLGSLVPNPLNIESIHNQLGQYGSVLSPVSIFNKIGTYGSQLSNLSPYNSLTNTPPSVYVSGQLVGYLTKNRMIMDRIDPDEILNWSSQNVNYFGR